VVGFGGRDRFQPRDDDTRRRRGVSQDERIGGDRKESKWRTELGVERGGLGLRRPSAARRLSFLFDETVTVGRSYTPPWVVWGRRRTPLMGRPRTPSSSSLVFLVELRRRHRPTPSPYFSLSPSIPHLWQPPSPAPASSPPTLRPPPPQP
jgi:hypothetical protein